MSLGVFTIDCITQIRSESIRTYVCVYTFVSVCIYMNMCVCISVCCIYLRIHVWTCVFVSAWTCGCVWICESACLCLCIMYVSVSVCMCISVSLHEYVCVRERERGRMKWSWRGKIHFRKRIYLAFVTKGTVALFKFHTEAFSLLFFTFS